MKKQYVDELRRQAEAQLAARESQIETLERDDLKSLAHELAVHQMELEIQNEELHRTQLQAEEARDRYLDLYDFAPVGYFTLDERNRIVEANLTACRLLRAERQDLLKTRFTKFIPDQDAEKFYFHRKETLESEAQQTCELRMHQADDAAFDARLESIKSGPDRLRVAVIDVTERNRAEEELRQRTAQLEHRTRQLQQLILELSQAEDRERRRIAQILHDDLQQMLAAAKFHLGLLKSRTAQDPALQAIAVKVEEMLKDAIEKSRSLSHELSPPVLHRNDLAEILAWLANQVQVKHGLMVWVDAPEEMELQSEAISLFLLRAAQEMLFNVIKHAGVNEARIRVRRRGRCICMTVSDRGRGFDARQQKETRGFGLFNIRERAELLGGRMKIRSAIGEGSTFRIVVPDGWMTEGSFKPEVSHVKSSSSALETSNPTPRTPESPSSGRRLRVLLADDHQVARQGLVSLLTEEHDIEVVAEAATGREAVELADRLHPDVVVMDVSMPHMSGDEATRQIKRHLPQTRIVVVSVYDEAQIVNKMHEAGAESYLLKTCSSDELLAAIRGKRAGSP